MSLTSLQHLEQKVNHLSEKLNWLLNHLGIDFPDHLNKGISQEQQSSNVSVLCKTENDQVKEKEENQFSSLIKFKGKRSLTSPELKVYPNKKRISSSVVSSPSTVVVNCDKLHTIKQVSIPSNRQRQQPNSALEESSSSSSSTHSNNPNTSAVTTIIKPEHLENETHSYIITQNSTEIVQSPTADNEIEIETVKYEPLEVEISSEAHGNIDDGETITNDSVQLHHQAQQHHHHHTETRYRIQEENNVLHIIKIESEPSISLDGEHTVINYSEALPIVQIAHDGNSQLSIGEETAIGFLNADGTVTPLNRPNVIINSSSAGLQQFEVLPLPPSPSPAKPPVEEVDPKGTFRCGVCNQEFTGLYLFRQHEKKSACRRISRLANLKKNPPVKNNVSPTSTNIRGGSIIGKSSIVGETASWKSYASPAATTNLPDVSPNSPVLKFKCNLCPSNFASAEYLRFHLSKIHNLPHTPD